MESLFKRNYDAVVGRKLITPQTEDSEFFDKLIEEVYEVFDEIPPLGDGIDALKAELADVITVCSNWIIHIEGNPVEELTKNAVKNEKRRKL